MNPYPVLFLCKSLVMALSRLKVALNISFLGPVDNLIMDVRF